MSLASVLPFLAALKKSSPDFSGMTSDTPDFADLPGVDMSGNVNAPSQVTLAQNTQGPPMGPPAPPPEQEPQPDMSIVSQIPFLQALRQQQQPEDSLGDIASAAPTGKAAQPQLAKGTKLLMLLQRGLMGGLSGMEANAQTYAATGRNASFGGGMAGAWQIPLQQRMMGLDVAQKIAGIGHTQAETQQAQMTTQGMPIKQALEQAQTEAAFYKDDPNLGLIDIRTGQPVAGGAGMAPLTEQEAQVLGKQPGERVPLKLKNTASEIVNRGVHVVQADGRSQMRDSQGNIIKDMGVATPMLTTNMRIEGMGQMREYPVIDGRTGGLQYLSAADLNKANQQDPGRYMPAGEGSKAMGKTALIEDIRGNISSVRSALQNRNMPEFTADQRAQIAIALGNPDAQGALSAAFRGAVLGSLTTDQQDYLIKMAQLKENAMAMRSVLGAGQGSEDMRAAITATIPGPRTPSKEYALKQLDQFEAVLNRLERGVPNVPLRPQAGQGSNSPATPQVTHRYNPQTGRIEAIQ